MADRYKIYKKDGTPLQCNGEDVEVRKGEVESQFLGKGTLTFSLRSAYPIPFSVGEYVMIDGEKYTLSYIPACKIQARKGTYGEAYCYDNIVMNWEADAMTRVKFLDYVLADNEIHYSNLPTVYFYGNVIDLCERIKANLDRVYPGEWNFVFDDELLEKRSQLKQKQLTLTDVMCWEAMTKVWDEFECLFYISGKTIKVGTPASLVEHTFKYGMGNGLKSITSQANESNAVITRLYVYGSQKNLQYRYYNTLDGVSDSMFIDRLMLPAIREQEGVWYFYVDDEGAIQPIGADEEHPYGRRYDLSAGAPSNAVYKMVKKGSGKTLNIYLESIEAAKKYGVMEGVVTFDNDSDTYFVDLVDDENGIYPHLTDRGIDGAEAINDPGFYGEDGKINPATFWMNITLDFDLMKTLLPGKTASIAMKSGKLIGREFEFNAKEEYSDGKIWTYKLTCNRVADNSIGRAFPYKDGYADYNAKSGDRFVLLNIQQPDKYVENAEVRLLSAGLMYLTNYDHTKMTYSPELDDIFLARHAEIAQGLKAGNMFVFEDSEGADAPLSLPIQQMKMKFGDELIRKYEVTLADTIDVKSDLIQRSVSAVNLAIKNGSIQTGVTQEELTNMGNWKYVRKDADDDNGGHQLKVGTLVIGDFVLRAYEGSLYVARMDGNPANMIVTGEVNAYGN